MHDSTLIPITAGVLKRATRDQLVALAENICADGLWETTKPDMIFYDHGTVFVRFAGDFELLIGIEPDGYTHS